MKKIRQRFNKGDWVKSHYRAPWIGIIQEVYWLRSSISGKEYPCYKVKMMLTCDGRKQVRQLVKHLSQSWLKKYDGEINGIS